MGGAASKVTRRFPKEKPSWAGSRTPSGSAAEAPRSGAGRPLASESKSEAIEADGRDPHFMSKLNMLGPVRVDHHMQAVRPANHDQAMYRSRVQSETEASNTKATSNRLLASSLSDLLETRKSLTTMAQLEALAGQYRIDTDKLAEVCRHFNTPSIDESTIVRTTDDDGEESVTMMARWVDSPLQSGR
ncbi:hypothetical protein ID866_1882 [Astraeus odoratus]|nr:hypothetical protein ID866_1882 [Astraeus odoratus]